MDEIKKELSNYDTDDELDELIDLADLDVNIDPSFYELNDIDNDEENDEIETESLGGSFMTGFIEEANDDDEDNQPACIDCGAEPGELHSCGILQDE